VSADASTPTRKIGIFERIAVFLLSRLPWFRHHYQNWGKAKRIIIGFLLYLICLPIIPIAIALVLFIRDPEGFRKSKAFPILSAIIVAWLAAFGYIATRDATPDTTNSNSTTNASTGTSTTETTGTSTTGTKSNNKTGAAGNPTNGRFFENCTAAFNVGVRNIPRGDKSYRPRLDHDNDGVACEK
jgi:hypothetical protein